MKGYMEWTCKQESIAVHVIHIKFCILDEVIVRKLYAVKIAILKHDEILPEATRGDQHAACQYSTDYNVFRYLFHIPDGLFLFKAQK